MTPAFLMFILDDQSDSPNSKWRWPEIEGLHEFKGKLLHSARWDANYDFKSKRIAVIGAGSSAIQIVPNLQPGKYIYI